MEIKKVALDRVFEKIKEELFLDKMKKLGFKYMKTRKCFESKRDDLVMKISIHLNHQSEYTINEDGDFYLNFDLTSFIKTKGFTDWYKKNFNEHWGYGRQLDKISTSFLVENPNFEKDDFYTMSEANSFKKMVSKSFRNNDSKKESINVFVQKIEKEIVPNILKKCNWEYLLKKLSEENKRTSWQDVRLSYYLKEDNAEKKYQEQLNRLENKMNKVNDEQKKVLIDFIRDRKLEYNKLFK